MTEPANRNRERAEEEAAAWLVRLSEAPDDAGLRARFEAWYADSALHEEIWARTTRAYDFVGKAPPQHAEHWASYATTRDTARPLPPGRPPAASALQTAVRQTRRPVGLSARRLGLGAAAAALAACLLLTVLPDALLHMRADLVTATGEVRATVLEDGSRVHLAPESAIELQFADGERRVRLIQGEAFFEVDADASSPFRVAAGDSVTTVLGTAFEVRRLNDAEAIAVQHGRVQVEAGGELPPLATELRDGEWLHVGIAGEPSRGRLALGEIAAWRHGELIARDRPMAEIVDTLRRYHSGAIMLQNDTFAARRVSGIYDLHSPAKTLGELAASHGARLRAVSPWLLIVTEP